jgi:hypothetical protein
VEDRALVSAARATPRRAAPKMVRNPRSSIRPRPASPPRTSSSIIKSLSRGMTERRTRSIRTERITSERVSGAVSFSFFFPLLVSTSFVRDDRELGRGGIEWIEEIVETSGGLTRDYRARRRRSSAVILQSTRVLFEVGSWSTTNCLRGIDV